MKITIEQAAMIADGLGANVNLEIVQNVVSHALSLPAPPEGHVRVRVAAMVHPDGGWHVETSNYESPESVFEAWRDDGEFTASRFSIITADLPLPAGPAKIVGSVE